MRKEWSKELAEARRSRQPFSCASLIARRAGDFPVYLKPLQDPPGQFTYVLSELVITQANLKSIFWVTARRKMRGYRKI